MGGGGRPARARSTRQWKQRMRHHRLSDAFCNSPWPFLVFLGFPSPKVESSLLFRKAEGGRTSALGGLKTCMKWSTLQWNQRMRHHRIPADKRDQTTSNPGSH